MGMGPSCPFRRKYPLPQPKDDAFFMAMAYDEAIRAWEEGEVPVGAVVVYDRRIIAAAHNRIEARQEATAHAEMLVLAQAARALGGWRLNGCTLYSTKEPCPMCAAAARLSRVDALVFGIPEPRPLDPAAPLPDAAFPRGLVPGLPRGLVPKNPSNSPRPPGMLASRASGCAAQALCEGHPGRAQDETGRARDETRLARDQTRPSANLNPSHPSANLLRPSIRSGILAEDCYALLRSFFSQRRGKDVLKQP
ncbi:MAG: nucleoside deaminase [Puniceicoccales bacterium]|jgi:tRNA(Arg) A34 adenosine deaminase TadA|nr:nucleoside deaminase [Puniceicoccales bacterium]